MQITEIGFKNYRNLNNLIIQFPTDISFIIGENGIGKSNILNALSKIFGCEKFAASDFVETEKELRIDISLSLSDAEQDFFAKYAEPTSAHNIDLIIKQRVGDDRFKVFLSKTNAEIPQNLFKNFNYFYYDSLRDALENDKCAATISDNADLTDRVFKLYADKKARQKIGGCGIRFSLSVIYSLFEKIINIAEKSKKSGQKADKVECVLAFDEPERHLHPFAQRALIKDLTDIANGQDKAFNKIIAEHLGIKSFSAQLLVVSHSDRIIFGGYENIVRLYNVGNEIKAVSGRKIKEKYKSQLRKCEKHLQKQFPYFCEALFAKKVLFVEGESELGAMNAFAKIMNVDLDRCAVSIINAYGSESINPLITIFSLFRIECLGLKDKDVYDRKRREGGSTAEDDRLIKKGELILTSEPNFEFEIVNAFDDPYGLYSYLKAWDPNYIEPQQASKVNAFIQKFDYPVKPITGKLNWNKCHDDKKKRLFLMVALTGIKSIATGAIIAEAFTAQSVPKTYRNVLERLTI